jgi:hypothetical protein
MPSHKSGRVKVGVRCRPPFEEEDPLNPNAPPVVACIAGDGLGKVQLTLDPQGSMRDFFFDYVFAPGSTQDEVYDTVASPIVSDVLRGFNGTVIAYGQTGTGKTHTMGILDRVENEQAGIIPRALGHIFGHMQSHYDTHFTVTISFLQVGEATFQQCSGQCVTMRR